MFHQDIQFPKPTRPSNAPSQDSNAQLQDTKLYNNPVLPDHAAIASSPPSSSSNANYSIMGDPSPLDQDVSVMTTTRKNVAESNEKFMEQLERFKVRNLDFEDDEENKLERFRVRTLDFDEEAKPC